VNERNVMRDGWFLFAAVLGIGAALTVFLSFLGRAPQTPPPAPVKFVEVDQAVVVPDQYAAEPLDAQAYRIGYLRGQNALFTQVNKPEELHVFHAEPQVQYTVSKDAPEEEQARYSDIMMQGYIDGYHRASDSMQCPRREY
jgi:hypothetical protein